MKFTIGTIHSSLKFEEEIKLIKSSLLYADEIELIGMVEYAVFKYLPYCVDSFTDIDSFADSFLPFVEATNMQGKTQIIDQINNLKMQMAPYKTLLNKKKKRTTKEILAQQQFKYIINQAKEMLKGAFSQITKSESATEINELINRKLISVFDYECESFNLENLAGGYLGNIIGIMQNNTSYPLFDSQSNKIISSISKVKTMDFSNIDNEVLIHAGLATKILMTLPTLDAASIDEILDFKKEMKGPLSNFRKAIYGFAEQVKSRPWDKDFQYDFLKIYNTEVVPKIEELNELSSETSVLKNMGRKVLADEEIRKKAAWAVGGLATTITTSSNMLNALDSICDLIIGASIMVIAPNAVTGLLKTLSIRSEAKREKKEIEKEMKGNTMYYYYKASKELK